MKEAMQAKTNDSKQKVERGFSLNFEEESELKVRMQSPQRLWIALYHSHNTKFYYQKVFTNQNIPKHIIQVYDSLAGIYEFMLQNYEKDLSVRFNDQKSFCELMMRTTVGKKEKVYQLVLQKVEYSQFMKISGKIKTLQTEIKKNNELFVKYRLIEEELKLKLEKEQSKKMGLIKDYEDIEQQVKKNIAHQQEQQLLRTQRKQKIRQLEKQIAENRHKLIQKASLQNKSLACQKGRKRRHFQLAHQIPLNLSKQDTIHDNHSCILQRKTSDKEQKLKQKNSIQRLAGSETALQKQKIGENSIINYNKSQQIIAQILKQQNNEQVQKSKDICNQTKPIFNQKFQSAHNELRQAYHQNDDCPTSVQNQPVPSQDKQVESKSFKGSFQSKGACQQKYIASQSINSQIHSSASPSVYSSKARDLVQKLYCPQAQFSEKVTLNLSFSNNIGKYQLIKTKTGQLLKRIDSDKLFHFITNSTAITGRQHFVAIIEHIRFQDFNFGIRASSSLNAPSRQWHSKIVCLAGCCKKLLIGTNYTNIELQLKQGDVVVTMADMSQRKVWFYVNKMLVKEIQMEGQTKENWYFFVDSCTKDNTIRLI